MPFRYDYECPKCGVITEAVVKSTSCDTYPCKKCNGEAVRIISTGVGLRTQSHYEGWTGVGGRWEHLAGPKEKVHIKDKSDLIHFCETRGIATRHRGGYEGDAGPLVLLNGG